MWACMVHHTTHTDVSTTPMQLYGATGAQSSILPALDTALGVQHPAKGTPAHLSAYLKEMRLYMPRNHRALLCSLAVCDVLCMSLFKQTVAQDGPSLRQVVAESKALLEVYDACVAELVGFRCVRDSALSCSWSTTGRNMLPLRGRTSTSLTSKPRALEAATCFRRCRATR